MNEVVGTNDPCDSGSCRVARAFPRGDVLSSSDPIVLSWRRTPALEGRASPANVALVWWAGKPIKKRCVGLDFVDFGV